MEVLKFDLSKRYGRFKPMNAVNNGPVHKLNNVHQKRSNIEAYAAAKIPYARNHDASFCADYGSEHSVDITAIFPDFNADPFEPSSYDFACTDEYIAMTALSKTKTFYRLGQKIEHYVKKFGTVPPKDFKKWAVICEHIIRHYNEGWSNGFHYDILYWEIWNEPDLCKNGINNNSTWQGTKEQFFDFYKTAATHLKSCFPDLKIGGCAVAYDEEFAELFLNTMAKDNVPLDFFSWHCYCRVPEEMFQKSERIKKLLLASGYQNSESILNEWNYIKDWSDNYIASIETIIGIKGAAFTMACMSQMQHSSVNMLMYYDARPSIFNGLFDFYTLRPLKGYYPFLWFSEFSTLDEIRSENEAENIYTLCGADENNKTKTVLTYYTDESSMPPKTIALDFGKTAQYEIYELSQDKTNSLINVTEELSFTIKPNSCLFIKEI